MTISPSLMRGLFFGTTSMGIRLLIAQRGDLISCGNLGVELSSGQSHLRACKSSFLAESQDAYSFRYPNSGTFESGNTVDFIDIFSLKTAFPK